METHTKTRLFRSLSLNDKHATKPSLREAFDGDVEDSSTPPKRTKRTKKRPAKEDSSFSEGVSDDGHPHPYLDGTGFEKDEHAPRSSATRNLSPYLPKKLGGILHSNNQEQNKKKKDPTTPPSIGDGHVVKRGRFKTLSNVLRRKNSPQGDQSTLQENDKANTLPTGLSHITLPPAATAPSTSLPPPLVVTPVPPPPEEVEAIRPIAAVFSPRLPPPLALAVPPPPPTSFDHTSSSGSTPSTTSSTPPTSTRSSPSSGSMSFLSIPKLVLPIRRSTAPNLPQLEHHATTSTSTTATHPSPEEIVRDPTPLAPFTARLPNNNSIDTNNSNNNNNTTTNNHSDPSGRQVRRGLFPRTRMIPRSMGTSNRRNLDAILDLPVETIRSIEDVVPLPPVSAHKLPPRLAFDLTSPTSSKLMSDIQTPRIPQLMWTSSVSSSSTLSSYDNAALSPSSRVIPQELMSERDRRMRANILAELVNTERDYVHDLDLVLELFLKPLSTKEKLYHSKLKELNSNLTILANVSRKILKHFDAASEQEQIMVGSVYLSMLQYFRVYNVYCSIHPIVVKIIQQQLKESEEFACAFEECMSDTRWKGLDLFSYLIKPIQRITKYPLLFKALVAHTPNWHPDHAALTKARKEMKDVVRFLNEAKRQAEARQRIIDLCEAIEEGEALGLCVPSRRIITEVDLRVSYDKGKPHKRKCILFNDVMLYLKVKKTGKFTCPVQRSLANLVAIDIWDTDEVQNAFMLVELHSRVKDTLIFPDAVAKEHYLNRIRAIVDKEQRTRFRSKTENGY